MPRIAGSERNRYGESVESVAMRADCYSTTSNPHSEGGFANKVLSPRQSGRRCCRSRQRNLKEGTAPEWQVDMSTVIRFRRTAKDAALATFAARGLVSRQGPTGQRIRQPARRSTVPLSPHSSLLKR